MNQSPPGAVTRVALLCAAVLVLEGYDLGAMAFTLPAISEGWHLKPAAFTAALTAASVGLFLGSLLCGWLGDRLGRKPVLVGCVVLFGVMSLATATAGSVATLTVLRFITGLGIGGGVPTTIALLSDLAPREKQGGLVMTMTCGVPAGNVVGGLVAARLVGSLGWPAVFVVGGLIPLILLPLLLWLLPESLRRAANSGTGNSIARLFTPEFVRITLLLWLINFLSLVTIYFINSWLPSLLRGLGIPTAQAILAATMFQLGGIVGGLGSAPLANRFGTEKIVAAMLAVGGGWLLLIGLTSVPTSVLAFFIFGAGLGISAAQLGVNALSGAAYPLAIRNTGTGWALGVGRLGNIAGPLFGGLLLALGWAPKSMLLLIALPAFLLSLILLALARVRGPQAAKR
ncbi:MAG TPA: MFS transporter [Rhizomicrobium sp.]|jgi:AAHS family 4-hydroxybenzoate transporter-like MFS transporter|nr:MFS transporter [Rhizomicrobium sp.]